MRKGGGISEKSKAGLCLGGNEIDSIFSNDTNEAFRENDQ